MNGWLDKWLVVHYNPKGKQKFFYGVRRVLLSFKNI